MGDRHRGRRQQITRRRPGEPYASVFLGAPEASSSAASSQQRRRRTPSSAGSRPPHSCPARCGALRQGRTGRSVLGAVRALNSDRLLPCCRGDSLRASPHRRTPSLSQALRPRPRWADFGRGYRPSRRQPIVANITQTNPGRCLCADPGRHRRAVCTAPMPMLRWAAISSCLAELREPRASRRARSAGSAPRSISG